MDPPTGTMDLPTGWGTAKCGHEESGEIASCFFNNQTGRSSIVPPPPHCHDDKDSNDSSAEDMKKKSGDLRVLFPQHPEELDLSEDDEDIFDPKESVARASTLREAGMTGSEDKDSAGSETAIQRTFDPDNMKEAEMSVLQWHCNC